MGIATLGDVDCEYFILKSKCFNSSNILSPNRRGQLGHGGIEIENQPKLVEALAGVKVICMINRVISIVNVCSFR